MVHVSVMGPDAPAVSTLVTSTCTGSAGPAAEVMRRHVAALKVARPGLEPAKYPR